MNTSSQSSSSESTNTSEQRIAILSCIHGNMAALEAVWDDLGNQNIDQLYCLGDLVGYGPYPNAVSYTHLRAHETDSYLVCRLLLENIV